MWLLITESATAWGRIRNRECYEHSKIVTHLPSVLSHPIAHYSILISHLLSIRGHSTDVDMGLILQTMHLFKATLLSLLSKTHRWRIDKLSTSPFRLILYLIWSFLNGRDYFESKQFACKTFSQGFYFFLIFKLILSSYLLCAFNFEFSLDLKPWLTLVI